MHILQNTFLCLSFSITALTFGMDGNNTNAHYDDVNRASETRIEIIKIRENFVAVRGLNGNKVKIHIPEHGLTGSEIKREYQKTMDPKLPVKIHDTNGQLSPSAVYTYDDLRNARLFVSIIPAAEANKQCCCVHNCTIL